MHVHTSVCKYTDAQVVIACDRVLVNTWPMCSRKHKRRAYVYKRAYIIIRVVLQSAYLHASAMSCANAGSKGWRCANKSGRACEKLHTCIPPMAPNRWGSAACGALAYVGAPPCVVVGSSAAPSGSPAMPCSFLTGAYGLRGTCASWSKCAPRHVALGPKRLARARHASGARRRNRCSPIRELPAWLGSESLPRPALQPLAALSSCVPESRSVAGPEQSGFMNSAKITNTICAFGPRAGICGGRGKRFHLFAILRLWKRSTLMPDGPFPRQESPDTRCWFCQTNDACKHQSRAPAGGAS